MKKIKGVREWLFLDPLVIPSRIHVPSSVVSALDYWLKAASKTATADDMSDADPQTRGIFPPGAPMSEAWKFKFMLEPGKGTSGVGRVEEAGVRVRSQRGTPEFWQTDRAHGEDVSPHVSLLRFVL